MQGKLKNYICRKQRTRIGNLCQSLSTHSVQPDCSASAYLNYLHRQLYVMDTYATSHNRAINHAMAAIHTYLSASFVAAIVAGGS